MILYCGLFPMPVGQPVFLWNSLCFADFFTVRFAGFCQKKFKNPFYAKQSYKKGVMQLWHLQKTLTCSSGSMK